MGPSIATQILLNSALNDHFELLHVDTNVHESLETLGSMSFDKVTKNLGIYTRFLSTVRKQQPGVVLIPISQTTIGFLKDSVFIHLSRLFKRTTLLQLRGSDFQNWLSRTSGPVRRYVEATLRSTQGMIVLGENLRYLFAPYYADDRIFVVPNGADHDIPRAAPEPGGPVRVLYLANLQPSKGIEDVIRSIAVLKAQGVDGFVLDVVGAWRDEPTREACLALTEEQGLPITFHGPAYGEDKFRFMGQSDVFVFTPREPEGHPWVIVEALAAGLPVVSTDQGAIVESVHDGVNGFIVPSHAPEQIAARLRPLIEQPDLRAIQQEASRRLYRENFTEGRMVERLRAVFEHLLELQAA
jgi:glycosyltransferase involved in cell wall biosynthesis